MALGGSLLLSGAGMLHIVDQRTTAAISLGTVANESLNNLKECLTHLKTIKTSKEWEGFEKNGDWWLASKSTKWHKLLSRQSLIEESCYEQRNLAENANAKHKKASQSAHFAFNAVLTSLTVSVAMCARTILSTFSFTAPLIEALQPYFTPRE